MKINLPRSGDLRSCDEAQARRKQLDMPFVVTWLRVNLLIRSISGRIGDPRARPIAKALLGRALAVRRHLARAQWLN